MGQFMCYSCLSSKKMVECWGKDVIFVDSTIINTAITAITSLATCLIGLRVGKQDAVSPSAKKIREAQLNNLYLPLERCFLCASEDGIKNALSQVQEIIYENLALVPETILNEFQKVTIIENPTVNDISALRRATSSFFNWTRKSMGYPYNHSAIKRNWVPTYERNTIIQTVAALIGILLWGCCTFVTIILFLGKSTNLAPEFEQICVLVASIGVFFILVPLTQSKSR